MNLDHLIEREQQEVRKLSLKRAEVRKGGGDVRAFQSAIDERQTKIKELRAEKLADHYLLLCSNELYPTFFADGSARPKWTDESKAAYREQHPELDFPAAEYRAAHPDVDFVTIERNAPYLVGA